MRDFLAFLSSFKKRRRSSKGSFTRGGGSVAFWGGGLWLMVPERFVLGLFFN